MTPGPNSPEDEAQLCGVPEAGPSAGAAVWSWGDAVSRGWQALPGGRRSQ